MSEIIRIAHLTDIHVAESRDAIVSALEAVAVAVPIVGVVLYGAIKAIKKLPPQARIPVTVMASVAALAAGIMAITVSTKARFAIQYVVALAWLYNQSQERNRRLVLKSLMENRVDHLLVTGDLTNTAHPDEFAMIRRELSEFGWEDDRVTILPGNHDRVAFPRSVTFESAFGERHYPIVRELIPGVILAALDSNLAPGGGGLTDQIFGNVRGHIDTGQIARLSESLDRTTDEFVLVGLHHPPLEIAGKGSRLPAGLARRVRQGPDNSDSLVTALPADRHLVLCGHDHPKDYQYDTTLHTRYGKGSAACTTVRSGKHREISYCIHSISPRGPAAPPETVRTPVG